MHRRKWNLLVALCCLVCLLIPLTAQAAPPTDVASGGSFEVTDEKLAAALTRLDGVVQDTMKQSGIPGLAIAVVHKDQVAYLKGFGVRAAGEADKVDADTVFQLASMSKPVGSTVVAALVSEGKVGWDDRIVDHLPDFQLYDPYATQEVTIRDMYAHRSGLPGSAGNDLENMGYDRETIIHQLRFLPPNSSFRSHYAYSNFGMTVGGVAAATAAGLTWKDASHEKLYRPLGMSSTSSRNADFVAATNRAALHVKVNGKWTPKFTRQPDAQSPAGGVSSTARDLAQWMRLELSNGQWNGQELIKPDALATRHVPHMVSGNAPDTGLPTYYGLGWNISYDLHGRVYWGHSGAFSVGTRTAVKLLPAEQLGIVVLTGVFPSGVPEAIIADFYDLVLKGETQPNSFKFWDEGFYNAIVKPAIDATAIYRKPLASKWVPLRLNAYVGSYTHPHYGDIQVVLQRGALAVQLGPAKRTFALRHWNRDQFLYLPYPEEADVPVAVTFVIGPDGKASRVILDDLDADGQGTFTRVAAQ